MRVTIGVLALGLLAAAIPARAQHAGDRVADRLRNRVEAAERPLVLRVGGEKVHASAALPAFYERRAYRPAWSNDRGPLPAADELVRALHAATAEGLRPADYHLAVIETDLRASRDAASGGRTPDPGLLSDLDLLLSDAFLVYASHLLSGRVNPETFDPEWTANRRGADLAGVLERAAATGGVAAALRDLLPPQPGYWRLREALARLRAVAQAGGWPRVPDRPAVALGERSPRAAALRRRLWLAGDLDSAAGTAAEPDLFDAPLQAALRRFQARHGLGPDGVLGAETLARLNVSPEERIRQIELNLERWRWLPQDLGRRHILVNLAGYWLEVVEDGRPVLDMAVVVGREYRRTPVFSDTMTYLVFSPYWNVPRNIAVQDKLPLIKRDPTYLQKQRMKVFEGWGAEAQEVDPATVDWSAITAQSFPYRLRQDPGEGNALGQVKFMFPNKYNVYLHDTPSRDLFARAERDFSSGCVRLEKPLELARYLLRDDPAWTGDAIAAAVKRPVEQMVRLRAPVPVHLLYWTAWADEQGTIHFRRDLYGRDPRLAGALAIPPPTSE